MFNRTKTNVNHQNDSVISQWYCDINTTLTPEIVIMTYCSMSQKGKCGKRRNLYSIFHLRERFCQNSFTSKKSNKKNNAPYIFDFLFIGHSRTVNIRWHWFDYFSFFQPFHTSLSCPMSLSLRTWKQLKSRELQWRRRPVFSDIKYTYIIIHYYYYYLANF